MMDHRAVLCKQVKGDAMTLNQKKSTQIAYFQPFQGHIHAPEMGIICMAVSDHMITGYTKEARDKADREPTFTLTQKMLDEVTSLPFIDNLYIRVGWDDVQKEKGKLCLSREFQMAVETARKTGKSWGLRIMQCSPSNPRRNLVPEFLQDKLTMKSYYCGNRYGQKPRQLPLYTDEYLKYWSEMLHLLGDAFDSDPLFEYADISGFGYWGEGHHGGTQDTPDGPGYDFIPDPPEREEEVISRLIQSHLDAFPKTPAVLNLVWSHYKAGRAAIADGAWVRRDSFYQWLEAEELQNGLARRPDAAWIYETVETGILMEDSSDPAFRKRFWDTPGKMADVGAAYGIVGFNPLDTLYAAHMMPELFRPFSERIGYRIRPSVVWRVDHADGTQALALGMINDGCANPPGTVILEAQRGTYKTRQAYAAECFDGRMHLLELPLPAGSEDTVTLRMYLKTGEKERSAPFAADTGSPEAPDALTIHLSH